MTSLLVLPLSKLTDLTAPFIPSMQITNQLSGSQKKRSAVTSSHEGIDRSYVGDNSLGIDNDEDASKQRFVEPANLVQ